MKRFFKEYSGISLIIAFFIFLSFLLYNRIDEDSYIYFRLARNIFDGYGYVFNHFGERIESGTSILWTLMLAVLYNLPVDIVGSTKIVSVLFSIGTLIMTYRLAKRFIPVPVLYHIPPFLMTLNIPFMMWSQTGLETPLFVFSITWFLSCLSDNEDKRNNFWVIPAIMMFTTRPESTILLLLLIPFIIVHRKNNKIHGIQLGILLGVFFGLHVWRFLYFNDLVVHPFYTRINTVFSWWYALGFLISYNIFLFLIPIIAILWKREFWFHKIQYLCIVFIVLFYWGVNNRVPFQPYSRHLVAFFPFIYIVSIFSIYRILLLLKNKYFSLLLVRIFLGVLLLSVLFVPHFFVNFEPTKHDGLYERIKIFLTEPKLYSKEIMGKIIDFKKFTEYDKHTKIMYYVLYNNYLAYVGEFINANYPAGSLIVFDQMGQTPYFAGFDKSFIDSLGLCSKATGYYMFDKYTKKSGFIALYKTGINKMSSLCYPTIKRSFTTKEILDYIYGKKPDVILIHQLITYLQPDSLPGKIEKDERLARYYTAKYVLGRIVKVYERNDKQTNVKKIKIPEHLKITIIK